MEQRTDEWYAARIGKVTASRVADVLATIKSGEAAARANYRAQLVAERLSGKSANGFCSAAMQWGIDNEEQARDLYSFLREEVREEGFVDHPHIENAGCSPDGLVNESGLLEIKCPETANHIKTLKSMEIPSKYIPQVMWQMACTGRKWCDFMSFDPRMPFDLSYTIIRIERDEEQIKEMEGKVEQFLQEVADEVEELKCLTKKQ
jgi:putative phage-type endonuclease